MVEIFNAKYGLWLSPRYNFDVESADFVNDFNWSAMHPQTHLTTTI
jgi:hypothetical protein